MSHRVTTKSEMKDLQFVTAACKKQGIGFDVRGDNVTFTGGALNRATLNLKTGNITGDTDHGHTETVLGSLRQAYSYEKARFEIAKQGGQIESETTKDGQIVLMFSIG